MKTHFVFAIGSAALLVAPLHAAISLFDFERDGDVAALKWASKGQSRLERTEHFATTGKSSLLFTSPTWRQGTPEWPAFEAIPGTTNWAGFDRLVVDLTNPHEERHHFAMFISDRKVPFRQGLSYTFSVPSRGYRRFVVPLSSFPEQVNRADISILHFFTQRPQADLALYLDNVTLLRQGESLPDPGLPFVQELAALTADAVGAAEQAVARSRQTVLDRELSGSGALPAEANRVARLQQSAIGQYARLDERLKALRADLNAPGLTLSRLNEISAELADLPGQAERALSIIRLQRACSDAGLPADNMLVGVATSMEKILPRNVPFEVKAAREVELSLARNEKESFQILVLPVASALRNVSVSATDLRSADGALFRRDGIECEVVGYIETKAKPPYETPQVGWWPDPILDFLGPVDVAVGDLQAFWIRLRAPKDQAPGLYRGTLTVAAEGTTPVKLDLAVRVRSFVLPDHSPLPVAITFGPHDHPTEETRDAQGAWRQLGDYPINAWKKHKVRWADFLADYYINYDSLYRHGPPDFEIVKRLHDRGQLVAFNLGIFDAVSRGPAAASNALADLRLAYNQARALGVLDHAYIYGFDECKTELFPLLEKTAQTLRREFPGALLMTTSYDHSYGLETVVKTIDAWCPLTPSFKAEQAARARAAGRHVWWYVCCGPHHPHANMFIEYPAIEGRLLMGAMTARQRPDGFLYYQISIWNSRKPITDGPFTDWDPRSWTSYHGDGSWTCVGPDGTPLPTVRLENFRDGLEDFAYVLILDEIIRRRQAEGASLTPDEQRWLMEAKPALPVPNSLVKSMTEYSRDPATLYAWRNRLGDLIDGSGMADVNPWGPNFGVRGLAATAQTKAAPAGTGGAIDLLSRQDAAGRIPGWQSYHESAEATTAEVWKMGADGVLVCRGEPKGYLYTEADYRNFVLTFEWRWPPDGKAGNGGVLLRTTGEHRIWPKSLEVQLNANHAGDFWGIGGFALVGAPDRTRSMEHPQFGRLTHVRKLAAIEKPVGEWNQGEVRLVGGNVTVRMNGTLVNEATGCDPGAGKLVLTAEGQEIHFRNLRLQTLVDEE